MKHDCGVLPCNVKWRCWVLTFGHVVFCGTPHSLLPFGAETVQIRLRRTPSLRFLVFPSKQNRTVTRSLQPQNHFRCKDLLIAIRKKRKPLIGIAVDYKSYISTWRCAECSLDLWTRKYLNDFVESRPSHAKLRSNMLTLVPGVTVCLQSSRGMHMPIFFYFSTLWRCDPTWVMAFSFLRFLDHTQRHTTVGRTTLDEWSARRRDLYLTTHNTRNRQTSMLPVGFETTI